MIFSSRGCIAPLTIGENQVDFEKSTLPESVSLPWNSTFPVLQVQTTLRGTFRLCDKAKWVVATPLLSMKSTEVSEGQGCSASDAQNRRIYWTENMLTALLGDGSDTTTSRVVFSGWVAETGWLAVKEDEAAERCNLVSNKLQNTMSGLVMGSEGGRKRWGDKWKI